jgi:aminocarboxymuconate-semialdehyde decarboxylase
VNTLDVIDIHAHFYPQRYLEPVRAIVRSDNTVWGRHASFLLENRIAVNPAMWDIQAHLDVMDSGGVTTQVLSLPIPQAHLEREADAVEAARITNDAIADLCSRYPNRFKGLIILPLPHVEASLAELDRGINELGTHGIILGASARGVPLDDKSLRPLWEEMNRLRLTVLLHPVTPPAYEELLDYDLTTSIGFLLDGALATLRLVNAGICEKYPDVRIVVPHMGAFILGSWDRIQGGGPMAVDDAGAPRAISQPAGHYLKDLYYDTATPSRLLWPVALETVGADRIVFGTDYPFAPSYEGALAAVEAANLTPAEREAVLGGNAASLLRA